MKKKLFLWAAVAILAVVTTLLAAVVIRTASLISQQLTAEVAVGGDFPQPGI